jgi:CHAP domain
MTDWWEEGYPGGPMVTVKGFPRCVYPPDAPDKPVSSDGPDVVAYKRTVSRAGRWPWGTFDSTFSNGFSHGKAGGNVGESGVAGVQRQAHLDATGWIGEKTFNLLRSIRIPEGLPNAGQPAMDATAVNQINQAFDRFHGHEPPPSERGSVREAALARAKSQLGTKESPAESNNQKYGSWYGMNGVPWCAIFVTWCFEFGASDVGKDSPSFVKGSRYSYCPYVVSDARNGNYGLKTTDDPQPGDVVVYDWGYDTVYDHIGIFERWSGGGNFDAIEGNTSYQSNSNGGEVMRRTRSKGGQGTCFVRVAEP